MVVAMGAAERFFDNVVDAAQLLQIFRCELKRTGGVAGEVVALPKNARTALGADDRIIGVLQYGDAIADADAQRATGPAFADDDANNRSWQSRHVEHALRDDLSLAALFGADAGICTGGVDQANDRELVFGG